MPSFDRKTLHLILSQFDITPDKVKSHGTGLINHTWQVYAGDTSYILQRVNDFVFKRPQDIAFNLDQISKYLAAHHPDYLFVTPIRTKSGEGMYYDGDLGWFRLFPFVADSETYTVADTPEIAYTAAVQFGQFTSVLDGFDASILLDTIPDFHNLDLRFRSFSQAIKSGNESRIKESKEMIEALLERKSIVDQYNANVRNSNFRKRVTHHDTKISNVLFDHTGKGLCVIDLDTVMSGYFFSDVGDMMRTYLSPASEEEKDFEKVVVRKDYYRAIIDGYNEMMEQQLSAKERESYHFAGLFMIYMQALRFLTDYLQDDIYYGAKYEKHNFVRAGNQLKLLKELEAVKE